MSDLLNPNEIINNRYSVIKSIAKGGIGHTFLAKDTKAQGLVALKLLFAEDIKDWKELELFQREIKVLKNLNHPLIPDYIDSFETSREGRRLFGLVQEYVEGDNLHALIEDGKRFSADEVLLILTSVLEILNYIHLLNPPVIHRDITPKNIILSKNNKVYLVDFGSVGDINKNASFSGDTFVGTVGYMPQEQFMGKVTPECDIYSLGMSIIKIITGKDPWELDESIRADFAHYSNVSKSLEVLINKMVESDATKRISSASKALDILSGKNKIAYRAGYTADLPQADNGGMIIIDTEKGGKTAIKLLPDKKNGKVLVTTSLIFILFFLILGGVLTFQQDGRNINTAISYVIIGLCIMVPLLIFGTVTYKRGWEIILDDSKLSVYRVVSQNKNLIKSVDFSKARGCSVEHKSSNKGSFYSICILFERGKYRIPTTKVLDSTEAHAIKRAIDNHISSAVN